MKTASAVFVCLFALAASGCWTESTLPACGKMPAVADAGTSPACSLGRTLLACTGGGMTEICLADDPSGCTVPTAGCENKCKDTEYAMACRAGTAPEGCQAWSVTPGGVAYYCCSCQ